MPLDLLNAAIKKLEENIAVFSDPTNPQRANPQVVLLRRSCETQLMVLRNLDDDSATRIFLRSIVSP